MIKRILGCLFMLLLVFANCSAMMFSQPEKIGHVYPDIAGFYGNGFMIDGATENQGIARSGIRKDKYSYEKGVAQFGVGNDSLYVHYDIKSNPFFRFGSREESNIINTSIHGGFFLYRINTNEPLILYVVNLVDEGANDIVVLGKREDGHYVKYIDTDAISKQYFGSHHPIYAMPVFNKDVVEISYCFGRGVNQKGKFCFKWDDAVQCFGVEQVVY